MIACVSAACAVAAGLAAACVVLCRAAWRRTKPVGSMRNQPVRVPAGRKLHQDDVAFVLDGSGQPHVLGEGTFARVCAPRFNAFSRECERGCVLPGSQWAYF